MTQQEKTPLFVWFSALGLSAVVFCGAGFAIKVLLSEEEPASLAAKPLPHDEHHSDAKSSSHTAEAKHDGHHKAVSKSHVEPKHAAPHDTKHDAAHGPQHDATHEPKHDTSHDVKHDAAHEHKHDAKHDTKHDASHDEHASSHGVADGSSWSYDGANGPKYWANLQTEFNLCGVGKYQSPINIEKPRHADISASIEFDYHESIVSIANNGRTIDASFSEANTIKVQGRHYILTKMSFHSPSEHLIENESFPLELQLEHKDDAGNIAIISVFIEGGKHNKAFDVITRNVPMKKDELVTGIRLNTNAFVPAMQSYLRYDGSLTNPPCSEGVAWHVMSTPISISADQIEKLTSTMGQNARPVQPLYSRNAILNDTGLAH